MKGRRIKYLHPTRGEIIATVRDKFLTDINGFVVHVYLIQEDDTGIVNIIHPELITEILRNIPMRARYRPPHASLDNFAKDE